jgi:hypothetical protein
VINLGKTGDKLIIDSRLAWHFIPNAFKVFLSVDPLLGAERVFSASRSDEDNPSLQKTLENNARRQAFEDERFQKLYGVKFRVELIAFGMLEVMDSLIKLAALIAYQRSFKKTGTDYLKIPLMKLDR